MRILDIGGNDGVRAIQAYPDADITLFDKKVGCDVLTMELPKGDWDLLLVNHLIEHLADPDDFLQKCRSIMNETTILEISTPNLCAWFNRILFMFGYLPHSYEVSFQENVGKAFGWNYERAGGHIRVFTPLALVQVLRLNLFDIVSVTGEHSTYDCNVFIRVVDRILSINPNLASAFRIKCKKWHC